MTYPTLTLTVMGTGYVGLVTGAAFAEIGHRVRCIDIDAERIARLKQGHVPIYEPGLEELLHRNMEAGRLTFSTDAQDGISRSDAVIIAVGTPAKASGGADLACVFRCADIIAESIRPGGVVITKSTVPVGTGDRIENIIASRRPGEAIAVVSNPEFLKEGSAIADVMRPDRIVTGSGDAFSPRFMQKLYAPLIAEGAKLVQTSRRSAELIKYAANAFLAAKITFINEISDLCEKVGADVADISMGIGLDRRIGSLFLQAGPGYGGSCFPKDTLALLRTAQESGVHLGLVEQTIRSNEARKHRAVAKVISLLDGTVRNKRIAVLGLTFKAGTDDMRESPAIALIESLQQHGASVAAHDPKGEEAARRIFEGVAYSADAYECAKGADAVVLATDWDCFKRLDLDRLAGVMKSPVMLDLRHLYDPKAVAAHGFVVETVGTQGARPRDVERSQPHMPALHAGDAAAVSMDRLHRKEKIDAKSRTQAFN